MIATLLAPTTKSKSKLKPQAPVVSTPARRPRKKVPSYFTKEDEDGTVRYFSDASCTQLHRNDGPAVVYKNGGREYYMNGLKHCDTGPAVVDPAPEGMSVGYREWWRFGAYTTSAPATV